MSYLSSQTLTLLDVDDQSGAPTQYGESARALAQNGHPLHSHLLSIAPSHHLFFFSKYKKVSKSLEFTSSSLEWHQLFLPSFGANDYMQGLR